jgi:hypothetical protein
MEYNEIAAKRRKKRKSSCFLRLLRLFAAILFSQSVVYATDYSVCSLFFAIFAFFCGQSLFGCGSAAPRPSVVQIALFRLGGRLIALNKRI